MTDLTDDLRNRIGSAVRAGLLIAALLLSFAPGRIDAQGTPSIDTSHGDRMVRAYLADQVRQIETQWLSSIGDVDDWEAERPRRRQELLGMLGLEPMPDRTPLQPVVTGTLEHDAFTVEKLYFQSMPGLYVTANLYIPKNREGPLPGVLYVCGHANVVEDGVSYGSKVAYQRHPAWYARHGYVALIIDTFQLGEIEGIHHGTYREDRWWWWNRGYTPLGVETWNGIRALDYLAARPEVDPERLAVTGRSGGGIYSWTITAVDDRIRASVPTAGITDLRNYVIDDVVTGHCDCMFMVNAERWDFPMIPALAAPRPLLLANGDVDPIFPLNGVLRVFDKTRQVYALYGEMDRFDQLIVNAPHEDIPPLRQGTYEWMHRQLRGEDLRVDDPATALFAPAELKVFDELPGDEINTRIDEVFVPTAPVPDVPENRTAWLELRETWIEALREETFGGWPSVDEPLRVESGGALQSDQLHVRAVDFDSQSPVRLRMWILEHEDVPSAEAVVVSVLDESSWPSWLRILHGLTGTRPLAEAMVGPGAAATPWPEPAFDPGRQSGSTVDARAQPRLHAEALATLAERLRSSRTALAVIAPRGIGPTTWTETPRGYGVRRSHMLLGQTIDGMRVWDVRRALRALRSDPALQEAAITVEGRGTAAGIALYAGLFEPGISGLNLFDLPETHRDGPILLNVRRVFDIPQAVAATLESVGTVRLTEGHEQAWDWTRQASHLASGTLQVGVELPWLVTDPPPSHSEEPGR